MSQTDEKSEQMTNMERSKEQSLACAPGCSCNTGQARKTRWLLGAIILVLAGILVARALMKDDGSATQRPDAAFALSTTEQAKAHSAARAPVEKPQAADPAALPEAAANTPTDKPEDKPVICGALIGSLSDLNNKALDKDGVFVFLAGQDAAKNRKLAAVIENSAATLRARNVSMGVFTLKDGSAEYADVTRQIRPPGVIAMVKGRGASAVSDDVTEPKLIQAFVAASRAGGCGPAGCGPAGCP